MAISVRSFGRLRLSIWSRGRDASEGIQTHLKNARIKGLSLKLERSCPEHLVFSSY